MLTRTYPDRNGWAIEHRGRIVAHAVDGDTADPLADAFEDCEECGKKADALDESARLLAVLAEDIEEFLDELRLDTATTLGKQALKAMDRVKAAIKRSRS